LKNNAELRAPPQVAGAITLVVQGRAFSTAFIGRNLLQSAFTGFWPPAILFKRLGLK
jgi:hypothetical protein